MAAFCFTAFLRKQSFEVDILSSSKKSETSGPVIQSGASAPKYLKQIRAAFAVVALFAVAACGGANYGAPGAACTGIVPPVLLYPSNGATGIPDGNFDLYVGWPSNPTNQWGVPVVTAANALQANGTIFTPALGPPPNAATPPPGDQAFVSHIPPLAAGATYSVALPGGPCGAGLGAFTTQ
jgi:hypothetical protein